MPFSETALVLRWIVPLWALGWLVLPLSSRLCSFLPDVGLAAGRVLTLVFVSLFALWGAALHVLPLSIAAFALIVGPLVAAYGWKSATFRAQIRAHWRAFLWSDVVFFGFFIAFLWVRLRHPEAGDLEKPMDMALLSSAMRAEFLPFQNPWFTGQDFTNYYYFGPLMGALLARALSTPPYFAYNLVQPLFCALFGSVLCSLSAALTKSQKLGLLVTFLVALGGHFEPLRQIRDTHQFWPLDWWKTSRVIENTINEIPSFSMLVGDLHAHFIAFFLAATHFCLCFGVLQARSSRQRLALLICGSLFLGVFVLTNTWDTPFYGLLLLGCALKSLPSQSRQNQLTVLGILGLPLSLLVLVKLVLLSWALAGSVRSIILWAILLFAAMPIEIYGWTSLIRRLKSLSDPNRQEILWAALPFSLTPLLALPYLWKFQSQVSGVALNLWFPALFSFLLLWGGWFIVGFAALLLPTGEDEPGASTIFRRYLIALGLVALAFPFVFYIRGYFGDGDLRHQDTVFKFGLQAWLLLGLGVAAEFGFRVKAWWSGTIWPLKFAFAMATAVFVGVSSLAPLCVAWTRSTRDAPLDENGKHILSLNAARFMGNSDQAAIEWLRQNAKPDETVLEVVGDDYDANFGKVAAFSGVPCFVGWTQHVWFWGAPYDKVQERAALAKAIFAGTEPPQKAGTTYLFVGQQDGAGRRIQGINQLQTVFQQGDTKILRLAR